MYCNMEILLFLCCLLLTALKQTFACTCMPAHAQQHYCRADFVLVATVKNVKDVYHRNELPQNTEIMNPGFARIPLEKQYKVRVHRTFKGMSNPLYQRALKKYIHTSGSGAGCGVHLKRHTTYLLSGFIRRNQLWINMCGWIQEFRTLKHHQRKFLKFLYKENCNCTVTTCFNGRCPGSQYRFAANTCQWNFTMFDNCYQRHGLCITKHGSCRWMRNNKFKICLKNENPDEPFPWRKRKFNNEVAPERRPYRPPSRRTNDHSPGFPGFNEP